MSGIDTFIIINCLAEMLFFEKFYLSVLDVCQDPTQLVQRRHKHWTGLLQ